MRLIIVCHAIVPEQRFICLSGGRAHKDLIGVVTSTEACARCSTLFGLLLASLVHDRAAYAVVLCAASLHKMNVKHKSRACSGWMGA